MSGVEDIEGLLGQHLSLMSPQNPMLAKCSCGWSELLGWPKDTHAAHRAHLAALIADLLREAQREAWDAGYARGVRDECSDLERADNPYADSAYPEGGGEG